MQVNSIISYSAPTIYYCAGHQEYRNKQYSIISGLEYVMEFDVELGEYEFYRIEGEKILRFGGISESLYLFCKDGKFIRWNIETKQVEAIQVFKLPKGMDENRLCGVFEIHRTVYFVGMGWRDLEQRRDYGIKYDVETNIIERFEFQDEFKIEPEEKEMYSFSSIDEQGNVYLISTFQKIHIFNLHTKEARAVKLKYGKKIVLGEAISNNIVGKRCIESVL